MTPLARYTLARSPLRDMPSYRYPRDVARTSLLPYYVCAAVILGYGLGWALTMLGVFQVY